MVPACLSGTPEGPFCRAAEQNPFLKLPTTKREEARPPGLHLLLASQESPWGRGQPGLPAPWALKPCPTETWCGPAALPSITKQSTSLLSRLYKDPRQRVPACYVLMGPSTAGGHWGL